MRAIAALLAVSALGLSLPAAATEVDVTRFHTAESLSEAGPGPIAVRAAEGLDGNSLAAQVWLDAVAAELTRQGFTVTPNAPRVAEVSLQQVIDTSAAPRSRTGVSIGVGGGSGGGWYGRRGGTSLGLGIGFSFGGKHAGERLDSKLGVTIVDILGTHLWEGRAEAAPRARSKDAEPHRLADEMAAALFSGFPGTSGETIAVR
jgi:hypothetical protein